MPTIFSNDLHSDVDLFSSLIERKNGRQMLVWTEAGQGVVARLSKTGRPFLKICGRNSRRETSGPNPLQKTQRFQSVHHLPGGT